MKKVIIIGAGLVFGYLTVVAQQLPEAAITVRVVNESNAPLSGIDTSITFDQPKYKPNQWGSPDVASRNGKTDKNGLFSATLASGNHVSFGARCSGCYTSHGSLDLRRSQDGKWQPWNPTLDLVVKEVKNPIAMYARTVETELPAATSPIGFDLIESDWVAPFGQGKTNDFVFALTKRVQSFHDFDARLLIAFSNPTDGISQMRTDAKGSKLRSPHNAPESSYVASLQLLQGNSSKPSGQYGMTHTPRDYVFRVRSSANSAGQIVSALYGKIYGNLEYFPISYKTAKLRFTYYLNPTPNDRNIEFDPKRNLFTDLKPDERVTEP